MKLMINNNGGALFLEATVCSYRLFEHNFKIISNN